MGNIQVEFVVQEEMPFKKNKFTDVRRTDARRTPSAPVS